MAISVYENLQIGSSGYCREFKHNNNLNVSLDDTRGRGIYDLEILIDQKDVEIHLKGRVVSDLIVAIIRQTSDWHVKAIAAGIKERLEENAG